MACSPSASRHSTELAAKAMRASPVKTMVEATGLRLLTINYDARKPQQPTRFYLHYTVEDREAGAVTLLIQ